MRLVAAVLLAMLILFGGTVSRAEDPPPPWQGVWRGTIGDLPVQACLNHRDYADQGAYFYLSHKTIIPLGAIDKAGTATVWSEAPDSDKKAEGPLWTLSPAKGDALSGEWRMKTKALSIRLIRVASKNEDNGPCSGLAFNAPRITPITIARKPAVKDGVAYTRLIANVGKQFDATLESFEMPGATPAEQKINARLRKLLPTRGEGSEYLECSMANIASTGYDGDYMDVTAPTMITRRWLVWVQSSATTCGGAHPDAGQTSTVVDRQTGEIVTLWRWFTPSAAKREEPGRDRDAVYEVQPPLLRAILARTGRQEKECREAIEDQTFWDIALTRRGFGFTPELPHVVQACADQIVLPYAAAAPFLTAAGKAVVASVTQDLH